MMRHFILQRLVAITRLEPKNKIVRLQRGVGKSTLLGHFTQRFLATVKR